MMGAMDDDALRPLLRKHVYDSFLEGGAPPVVEELMQSFSLSRETVERLLGELAATRQLALVKGTSRVLMAWPFSAIATPFVVETRGREYFANCAWDAVAFHSMLDEDEVLIRSFCHHCAQPIEIDFRGGRAVRVDPPEAIMYLAIPAARWWDDIILTCSNTMVFFASPEHRDASTLCAGDGAGASLTPDEAHTLSGPVYARRLAIDYARPPRDELVAHFRGMGLEGDFWEL